MTLQRIMLVMAVVLIMSGVFLPVDGIVSRAIPADILKTMETAGQYARITELRNQLVQGLFFTRIAFLALGVWFAWLSVYWKRLTVLADIHSEDEVSSLPINREWWMPLLWFFFAVLISMPLLSKGFEHAEYLNYAMLAERGPMVTMACQNLPPRAAQVAFTVVESLFVKLFGGSEIVARLPAVLFGAMVMFPLFLLARRFGTRTFANLVCAGMSLTGFFLFYITYAKGYALAMTSYVCCVLLAVVLRTHSGWKMWSIFGGFIILTCYTHLASCIYLALLIVLLMGERLVEEWGRTHRPGEVIKVIVKPVVVSITAALVLFLLYSPGIPAELKYIRTFDLSNYYMAYHINSRFLGVMIESWAWVRDCSPLALLQAILFMVGIVFVFRVNRRIVLYVLLPAIISVVIFWSRDLFVYPRFFIHFLPFYVLFCLCGLVEMGRMLRLREKTICVMIIVCLVVSAPFTLSRLYGMERCGARTAVEDVRLAILKSERVMAVLDGYITVKHYYPGVVSGYRDRDFWCEVNSEMPPEYIISVPYIEYDMPGARRILGEKYNLSRKYSSWLDVDDDQDSVYLYKKKVFRSQ